MEVVNVGVAASSDSSDRQLARRFVGALSTDATVRLIVGGYWGLMRDVAEEASVKGMTVVFILPLGAPDHPPRRARFITVDTGLEFRARSVPLCRSSDVLVCLGGESGSIIEAYMAYAMGKPVILLENTGHSSDRLVTFGDALDMRGTAKIHRAPSPEDAARMCLEAAGASV
jgi:uncharacterized protein (TIGR00725 family)